MTDIKGLKPPEHGNEFCINKNNNLLATVDLIVKHNNRITLYLASLLIENDSRYEFTIPCVQCFKDVTLECEDLARLMNELIEKKK